VVVDPEVEMSLLKSFQITKTLLLTGILLAMVGCAPAPEARQAANPSQGSTSQAPARPKVLHVAVTGDSHVFHERLKPVSDNPAGAYVNAGLTHLDHRNVAQPILLERLPSQGDGTWIVNPDGTMKTTYNLRPNLKWQDGQPLTASDFVFAYRIYRDKEIPLMFDTPERWMSSVVAVDDRTIEVNWSQLFVEAGAPAYNHLSPIPRHILEEVYDRDKNAFVSHPFWTTEQYVGAGPFAVSSREIGSRTIMQANPHFVFGRPQIDTVEMVVVPDKNAIAARVLAGDVDFVNYSDIPTIQAKILKDQWESQGKGTIITAQVVNRGLVFQYRDVPRRQKAMDDVRVRQALMHAIDREELGRLKTEGLAGASDTPYPVDHYLYPRIDRVISHYPLDVRRTETLLNQAGWTKGTDNLFRNASGETLDIEATASSDYPRTPVIIADFWKRAGINATPNPTTEALDADTEYRASYPGVSAESWTPGIYDNLTASQLATPSNSFRGRNRGGYNNPQFNALADRLRSTLEPDARDEVFVEMERFITSEVAIGHLYYQVRPAVVIKGLKGIITYPYTWNPWEWRFE
jgi:peptide/nickel transport system substrate-binding protein